MKTINVVAAVIRDGERLFATQRGYGEFKDFWEFPGGKIEEGETPKEALKREILEELDTEIEVGPYITMVDYDYLAFHLHMECFYASVLSGDLILKEHEAARWLSFSELGSVNWLPADKSLIQKLMRDNIMIKAVFFDMFNTLADPHVYLEHTESDILGMSTSEWASYVWREDIARDRGLGVIKTEDELMDRIWAVLPYRPTDEQREAVKLAHRERQRRCMTEIPEDVLETVKALKGMGFKLGVISNADITDNASWPESPLYPLFDDAIFSCDVGLVKPDKEIYELAFERLGVLPSESVFIGDGGSKEHMGAKALGMTTIWTEHLTEWDPSYKEEMSAYVDWYVKDFKDIQRILAGFADPKELLKKAMDLAREEFKGITDKSGVDYFKGHLSSVAALVKTDKKKTVAFLHDIVEDRDYPLDKLRLEFGDDVADAVRLLTHEDGLDEEGYLECIRKIKRSGNELAIAVKTADLTNNSDYTRLGATSPDELSEKDRKRYEKYLKALAILRS